MLSLLIEIRDALEALHAGKLPDEKLRGSQLFTGRSSPRCKVKKEERLMSRVPYSMIMVVDVVAVDEP